MSQAKGTPPDGDEVPPRSIFGRSRVTNGRLPIGDGRSRGARRYRDLTEELLAELGREPTVRQRIMIHRVAGLTIICEAMEGRITAGLPVDPAEHRAATYGLMHAIAMLGLPRSGSEDAPAGPSLAEILERHGGGG
ncbi:MAG: hypothetical protein WD270_03710 [Acetobacterales bacterium]